MTTAMHETTSPEAEAYVKAVASHLGAVPADERAEMLDDLTEHLRELSAEPGLSIIERLGPAKSYADELLASAGFAPDAAVESRRSKAAAAASRTAAWFRETGMGREAARVAPVARPTWWVLRAYLAVSLLTAVLRGRPSYPGFPLPHLAGSALIGLAGVLVAIPLSVRLGQRPRMTLAPRLILVAVNLVLVAYSVVLLARVSRTQITYIDSGSPDLRRPRTPASSTRRDRTSRTCTPTAPTARCSNRSSCTTRTATRSPTCAPPSTTRGVR
jgi:hypothetical protein